MEKNKIHHQEFFSYFPKRYINLERCKERREELEKRMNEYGITNYKRVKGYDYKDFTGNPTSENFVLGTQKYHNLHEIAITMSHIKAILSIDKMGIIMEDDIRFNLIDKWQMDFKDIVDMIPDDCEILLLCCNKWEKKQKILPLGGREGKGIANGVCYLATEKAKKKLSSLIENEKYRFDKIDGGITFDLGFVKYMKTYYLAQSLFVPETYQNNINASDKIIDQKLHLPSKKILDFYSHGKSSG
jgi:hypothetical protein